MISLKNFKENHLDITWMTIKVGLQGPGKFLHLLSEKDILDYVYDLLTKDESQSEDIWMLSSLNERESEEINAIVNKLTNMESGNADNEVRKWRVLLLLDTIQNLNVNPLYGLITLTEFWEKFDYPSDSPLNIQGVNNNITPEEYYTEDNYEKIIQSHKEWIENELKCLAQI